MLDDRKSASFPHATETLAAIAALTQLTLHTRSRQRGCMIDQLDAADFDDPVDLRIGAGGLGVEDDLARQAAWLFRCVSALQRLFERHRQRTWLAARVGFGG